MSGYIAIGILVGIILFMKKGGDKIRNRLPQKLADIYARFETGTILSLQRAPLMLGLSVMVWILEALRLFFVVRSVHLEMPFLLVIFATLMASLLTALPLTPAGLGVVEASLTGILVLFGYEQNTAFGIAILDRLISYWSILFFGYFIFVVSKRS